MIDSPGDVTPVKPSTGVPWIHYVSPLATIPWVSFKIEKNFLLSEIYGTRLTFTVFRLAVKTPAKEFPVSIYVKGKQHTIEFQKTHAIDFEGVPSFIYIPKAHTAVLPSILEKYRVLFHSKE